LETLKIEITNNQLQQIITLAERLQNYTRMVKLANRHKLTQEEMKKNRDDFLALFPDYYNGWGKNLS
jgi:non-ribosomal peptide synthetase component E (peptide arylation enzyme)